ncbi:carbohydrate sulfotransferase 15-like isoform X2 [Apostichopus japonicus]|uniref:carbohydrate sulfotransferase 15-like isoform X2 n=1 Tax=Stichopus japonicus TaxID=307972 RepID=UPI003AB38401
MNKGTPVVAITVCLLFIFVFGFYIESHSAKTSYVASFMSDRAIVVSSGVTQGISDSDYDIPHRDRDTDGVIRGLGQLQHNNVKKHDERYAVQLDEAGTITTLVQRVLGDDKDPVDGEKRSSQNDSSASPDHVTFKNGHHAQTNSTVSKSHEEFHVKEYVVNRNEHLPPGPLTDQKEVQRQLGEIYKKRKSIPPQILSAQMAHIQGRYSMSSRLQTHGPRNWRNLPAKLYNLAPVIFDTVPRDFLPQFKNPCWYSSHKQLLCLPYFYILGFPKAGTTDLWDKVNNHPKVSRTRKKETHFWRDRRIGSASGFLSYMSNALFLNNRLQNGETDCVFGDGSATTVISHARYVPFFPNVTAGMYTSVDIIKEITPAAKMIIAIREPAERLYSGYLYHPMKQRRSVEGFHQEVLDYLAAYKRCQQHDSQLQCIFEKKKEDGRAQRLKTGIYEPFIRTWLDGFGSDQVKIIRLEDWKDGCLEILPKIFEFLELAPQKRSSIERLCIRRTRNQAKKYIGPMQSNTRQMLEKFYAPYNARLCQLLNSTVYPPYS